MSLRSEWRVVYEVCWPDNVWYTDSEDEARAKREEIGPEATIFKYQIRLANLLRFVVNLLNRQDCFYFQGVLDD